MSDGLVLQCARVDRLPSHHALEHSTQIACAHCRHRVWLSKPGVAFARSTTGIKPVCDVCRPAKSVGTVTPG